MLFVTAIYDLNKYNQMGHSIEKLLNNYLELEKAMNTEDFTLIIYCNKIVYDAITRNNPKIIFIIIEFESLWTYKYVNQITLNRQKYHPTKDVRTFPESHALVCAKFWFVSDSMDRYPDHTHYGWIDVPFSKSCHSYKNGMITEIINDCTTNPNRKYKFNIQILNVVDKKYKDKELKREYYEKYRWLVCGNCFITHVDIGKCILNRLKEIFLETLEAGYGHGEEMLYLEILDEFYSDIYRSYGDYKEVLDNFIKITQNINYVFYQLQMFILSKYSKEAHDCLDKLLEFS